VVNELGDKAILEVENYGESELAQRYGVTRYPAIFVDDVLVATPKDFGFYGGREGEGQGRYAPITQAASHERFRTDLRRAIELVAAGKRDEALALAPSAAEPPLPPLPAAVTLTTLDGRTLGREALAGKIVVVEHWATWCPPCRGTLSWLGELAAKHPDRLAVLAVAVESNVEDVRAASTQLAGSAPVLWAMSTPELETAFGAVTAVPTLRVYDGTGKAVAAHFGATPGLHAALEAQLAPLLAAAESSGGD
jgi:cytochrome c biogenesis protein CcmG/thiol:disulfide interchange protein DsbE